MTGDGATSGVGKSEELSLAGSVDEDETETDGDAGWLSFS